MIEFKKKIEEKLKEVADWQTISYYIEQIKECIQEMERHKVNNTDCIRYALTQLEELFDEAERIAFKDVLNDYSKVDMD